MNSAAITPANINADLNGLVRKHTAFGSFAALEAKLQSGYVPTITKKSAALGMALTQLGWKVWEAGY